MSISSIVSSGMQSMRSSINRTAIAGSGLNVGNDDLAVRMVAMREGEIEVRAAANVIKTGDQILGTIIDIRG
jgi:flagellar hook protein FlgE